MKFKIGNGSTIETVTPGELADMLAAERKVEAARVRVRAPATLALDATGSGTVQVYKVPAGASFAARRVSLNLTSAADPSTGAVALNVTGKYIQYLRSDYFIEYAIPLAPTGLAQVPGVQTWSEEEGPYLRNGEQFAIKAVGLTASVQLWVELEGILYPEGSINQGQPDAVIRGGRRT